MYLTRRQKQILDFIEEHLESFGYAPSIEEICAHFGLRSTATVHKHLSNLEEKGFIRRLTGRSRSIELSRGDKLSGRGTVSVPLLGRIAAGRPIEAVELPENIELPSSLVGRRTTYMLKVLGDSMIDEQIRDGDYVIVEQRDTAENGQIVVALIDGEEVTLKRFYREKDSIRLQPANVNMSPIILREGEFKIQGVVIGVLRKY
ncbi:MAG TPA: transcriptional repressor LexA [archaeon]|nr:transcriptional repressor LexA [archaeon]